MINDTNVRLIRIRRILNWLAITCLALAGISLAIGYTTNNFLYLGLVALLVSGLGIIANARTLPWMTNLAFIFQTIQSGAGFILEIEPYWLITGIVLALFAWDLQALSFRIMNTARIDNPVSLVLRHISRLLVSAALSLILMMIALSYRIELGFGWLVLLSLVAILALSYAIGYLIRKAQS